MTWIAIQARFTLIVKHVSTCATKLLKQLIKEA